MKTIKIYFCGFWGSFINDKNLFTILLSKYFNVEITDNPDFVICSNRSSPFEYMKYDCPRIMFMGENLSPDLTVFDYVIGFDYLDFGDRYFRLPFSFYYDDAKPWIPEKISLEKAKDTLKIARNELVENGLENIHICPETMGKINQLGTLEEVLQLCLVDESFIPCIDFGHLNCRTFGNMNCYDDFENALNLIDNMLGYDRLKNFHSHFSKIEWTKKGGEKKHLTFADQIYGPNFEPLGELIAKRNLSPYIICESAGTQAEDAVFMKKTYNSFKTM